MRYLVLMQNNLDFEVLTRELARALGLTWELASQESGRQHLAQPSLIQVTLVYGLQAQRYSELLQASW